MSGTHLEDRKKEKKLSIEFYYEVKYLKTTLKCCLRVTNIAKSAHKFVVNYYILVYVLHVSRFNLT